jgi:biotin operon repressor
MAGETEFALELERRRLQQQAADGLPEEEAFTLDSGLQFQAPTIDPNKVSLEESLAQYNDAQVPSTEPSFDFTQFDGGLVNQEAGPTIGALPDDGMFHTLSQERVFDPLTGFSDQTPDEILLEQGRERGTDLSGEPNTVGSREFDPLTGFSDQTPDEILAERAAAEAGEPIPQVVDPGGDLADLPGTNITPIDPETSLIQGAITPEISERLGNIQGLTDQQIQELSEFGGFQDSADLEALQNLTEQDIQALRDAGIDFDPSQFDQSAQDIQNLRETEITRDPERFAQTEEDIQALRDVDLTRDPGRFAQTEEDIQALRDAGIDVDRSALEAAGGDIENLRNLDLGQFFGGEEADIQALRDLELGFSDETGQARSTLMDLLGSLSDTPSRTDLALEAFDLFSERGEPRFQQELQNVGRQAASLGRIGAGLTTSQLGDVQSNRERELALARRELANTAAGQTLQDQLAKLGGAGGVASLLGGQDLGLAGLDLSRLQDISSRAGGAGERRAGLELGRAGQVAGLQQGLGESLAGLDLQEGGADISRLQDIAGRTAGLEGAQSQEEFQSMLANLNRLQDISGRSAGLEGAESAEDFQTQLANLSRLQDVSGRQTDLDTTLAQLGLSADTADLSRLQDIAGRQTGLEQFRTGAERDLTQRNLDADRGILSDLLGAEGQTFGEESAFRDELRGERDFQQMLERQGRTDQIEQILLEEQLFDADFQRRLQEAGLLGELGSGF